MAYKTERFQSFIDVVRLMQEGFNVYLESTNKPYRQHVQEMQDSQNLNMQVGDNILLIYKLSKRQAGSKRRLFEEKTFLRPIPITEGLPQPSGTAYISKYMYWLDNMITFSFYNTEYSKQQRAQEDFIEYMSLVSIMPDNIFTKNGFMVPQFWYQEDDKYIDVKETKVYVCQLNYQVQTEQEISVSESVIRSISFWFEYVSSDGSVGTP